MPAPSLPKQVAQHREQMLKLLREISPESATWVEELRARRRRQPTVVTLGETNRGKSSLVNALLDRPGLSPVDADVATATYLIFGHAEEWEARACYPGHLAPIQVDLGQLVNWVSAGHDLPEGHLPPRYVEVDGPVELLSKISIVDTPGVGGLDSVHGELALEAAASATALLFVVDASAPFTVGELNFLRNVGDRVETVLFALSKVDQYRGWRQVLEANQSLLRDHAPRFADSEFHPVSARMYEMAGKAPNQQAADMLKERSGLAALADALQELVIGKAAMLAEANTMRALTTSLDEVKVQLTAESRALTTGADEAKALRARKEELTAQRKSAARGWQVKLRGEIQRTRVENTHEVSREMRDMQTWFRQAIDVADRETLAALPGQVDAALQLVSRRISTSVGARLNKIGETVLVGLFSPDELVMLQAQYARAGQPPVVLRSPEKRPGTSEDKLMVMMGISGGVGLGKLATLPLGLFGAAAAGTLGVIVAPVTIVLGLGAGWWISRTRRHSQDKQHMKTWLTDAIADARSTLDQMVADQLIQAEQELSLALDDALGRRIAAIEEELREVDKAMRLDATERSKRLQAVNKHLAQVESGSETAKALLARIRTAKVKPAAQPG
ncbi:dynamin family protein [Kibdelosporangium persicum]|uniref:50S ribosome-binding GTPase n=1 Tax=Kibdelosporangium persicum TaxID=2698649 RepID=A0ABX2EYP4_9PSEU|nr:dynamin family protein [Kibdelosporangium persicum]NRN63905.1 50S ribosome-binding GTPase [Kibdelosporangium persicum]